MEVELVEVSAELEELALESAMVELEVLAVLVLEPVMVEQALEPEVDSVQPEEQVAPEKQAVKVDTKQSKNWT